MQAEASLKVRFLIYERAVKDCVASTIGFWDGVFFGMAPEELPGSYKLWHAYLQPRPWLLSPWTPWKDMGRAENMRPIETCKRRIHMNPHECYQVFHLPVSSQASAQAPHAERSRLREQQTAVAV